MCQAIRSMRRGNSLRSQALLLLWGPLRLESWFRRTDLLVCLEPRFELCLGIGDQWIDRRLNAGHGIAFRDRDHARGHHDLTQRGISLRRESKHEQCHGIYGQCRNRRARPDRKPDAVWNHSVGCHCVAGRSLPLCRQPRLQRRLRLCHQRHLRRADRCVRFAVSRGSHTAGNCNAGTAVIFRVRRRSFEPQTSPYKTPSKAFSKIRNCAYIISYFG